MTTKHDKVDWENPFKAEDFGWFCNNECIEYGAAKHAKCCLSYRLEGVANARFRELIRDAHDVYGRRVPAFGIELEEHVWGIKERINEPTHKARLICIEEIK